MDQRKALELEKEACKRSLHYLCNEVLYKDFPGGPKWGRPHDEIEKMLVRPSKRKLILIPRGHLKTANVTKAYPIKRILNDPNVRILLANQVWDKSREMLYEIKELLTSKSKLPHLFGSFVSNRWRDDEIVVSQRTRALSAPTIATTGCEAELTSAHYDLIIADDLQGVNNSQTKDQRDKVKRWFRMATALLDPGGELIVVGTRYHYDDIYQEIMDHHKDYYDIMVRSVIEDGKLIFPEKFNLRFDAVQKDWIETKEPTMDYIDFLRQDMGPDFAAQYMNEPIDEQTQLIKRNYFKYFTKRPEDLHVAITVDPAMSFSQRSDFTAIMACGMDKDRNIFVLDYIRGHWGSPADIIHNILSMCDKWRPLSLGIEENGFQKSLRFWMEELVMKQRKIPPISKLKAPVTKTKEYRLKALEPYYRNGMVYHHQSMKGRDLENELLSLTSDGYKGKNDDLFDALAWQLDLLIGGKQDSAPEIPHGSWMWEKNQAIKHLSPYDFFKE